MDSSSAYSSSPSQSSTFADDIIGIDGEGTYRIVTVCFDKDGNEIAPVGVAPVFDTGVTFPIFGIVKPAVTNTCVDMSPYGQSVFTDAVDAIQAVDLTFMEEVESKECALVQMADLLIGCMGYEWNGHTNPAVYPEASPFRVELCGHLADKLGRPSLRFSTWATEAKFNVFAFGE